MKKFINYTRATLGTLLLVPGLLLLAAALATVKGWQGIDVFVDGLDAMTDSLN